MSDERLDIQEASSVDGIKEVDMGKDWEMAIDGLNAYMLEETPNITDVVRQYFLDLGHRYQRNGVRASPF